jgi:heme/copper-type cytochrome/quinol oxidase subunit 3
LYFYARPQAGPGPKELDVPRTLVFSVCLFASSFTFWRSEVALTKQRRGSMLGWLALTILLGGVFLVGQGTSIGNCSDRGRSQHQYVFNHVLHPDWLPRFARAPWFIALLIFLWLAWEGDFASDRRESAFKSVGYYWHFVDVVWVFVLLTVYILPLVR